MRIESGSRCDDLRDGISGCAPAVRLGLPHLGLYGLSENWVLRECGDKHWNAIAEVLERRPESTFDRNGDRLYASIYSLRVRGPIRSFVKGDEVDISVSDFAFVSASRFYSSQCVKNKRRASDLQVELLSAFVRRKTCGDNKSLCPSLPLRPPLTGNSNKRIALEFMDVDLHLRLAQEGLADAATCLKPFRYRYSPSPIADFNAAGLFYFAEYPSLIDRAEWLLHRDVSLLRPETLERQIAYFGSPNLGEDLAVDLLPVPSAPKELRHMVNVFEVASGRLLSRAYTVKKLAQD